MKTLGKYISHLVNRDDMSKAGNLAILKKEGFGIPEFIVTSGRKYRLTFKAAKYIVRSSFDLEDSKNSFAGIFKSYGPIRKKDIPAYLEKVLLSGADAKVYMKKMNITGKLRPGALVQRYVFSSRGGVCFTDINKKIMIESGKSADTITSGKEKKVTSYAVPRTSLDTSKYPKFVKQLVSDALDIESVFGKPQDVEWALDKNHGDQVIIFQTREAKSGTLENWSGLEEFMSIVKPSDWDRYLAFSFLNSKRFQDMSYDICMKILRLEKINWRKLIAESYKKPASRNPIEAFREVIINYGYYGLLNQLTTEGSLAMKRLNLSIERLGLSQDELYNYAIRRKKSVYSKILKNPEKYKKLLNGRLETSLGNRNLEHNGNKIKKWNFTPREKRIAEFFAMLYDIKCYSAIAHEYRISPLLSQTFDALPKSLRDGDGDYITIFESLGFVMPKIRRHTNKQELLYDVPSNIEGIVGKEILIYRDVPTEAVLAVGRVKCLISERSGILSHAAILAREFNIPFIAGVKNAAKLFHEGDKLKIVNMGSHISIKNISRNAEFKVGTRHK